MRKNYFWLLLIFLFITGCSVNKINTSNQKGEKELIVANDNEIIKTKENDSRLNLMTKNDINKYVSDWATYRNERLGFEMQYPKYVLDFSCNFERILNPLVFIEDENGVYVSRKYYYERKEDQVDINKKNNQNCVQKEFTLPLIREKSSPHYQTTWYIKVKKIFDLKDLDNFTKNELNSDCVIIGLEKTKQQGVFYPIISSERGVTSLEEDGCFINWMFVFMYYPTKNKAVIWDIGQEYNFLGNTNDEDDSVDYQMINTFKFIESNE